MQCTCYRWNTVGSQMFRDYYARSEIWRVEWSLRTGISVAAAAFLFLLTHTANGLTDCCASNLPFAAFVTVMVKDITFGATVANGWASIFGSFIASFLCWIFFAVCASASVDELPFLVTLMLLFIGGFILQYLELQPMGKKLGVSMIPVNVILNRHDTSEASGAIWGLFASVIVGVFCGLVGCMIPLPMRFAGTELKGRLLYYSEATSALVQDMTESWLSTHYSRQAWNQQVEQHRREESTPVHLTAGSRSSKNPHWQKLRLVILSIAALKRTKHRLGNNNYSATNHSFNTRYIRVELSRFLREELQALLSRNKEARLGPNRNIALRCERYVRMIGSVLLILTRLERHIEHMEQLAQAHNSPYRPIYAAFLSRPNLRYALVLYAAGLSDTIHAISRMLAIESSSTSNSPPSASAVTASFSSSTLSPTALLMNEAFAANSIDSVDEIRAIQAAAKLLRARKYFDVEYLRARRDIYYPEYDNVEGDKNTKNTKDANEHHANIGHDNPTTGSGPTGLPLYHEVLFDFNSVIFLLESMSRLLLEFWPANHLKQVSLNVLTSIWSTANSSANSNTICNTATFEAQNWDDNDAEEDAKEVKCLSHQFSLRSNSKNYEHLRYWLTTCRELWNDLVPKQSHLLLPLLCCFTHRSNSSFGNNEEEEGSKMNTLMQQQLRLSFKVALAMVIAAVYGVLHNRPQPALAAFTIAYLSGGAVAGINVTTCIHRAAGTAVASVYAIMVEFVIHSWTSLIARNIFLGAAVVLFQLPSTYCRSFPQYSYAGTVAGFTAALLLLTPNVSANLGVTRIVDTFVGVLIYLLVEFSFFAIFTEAELLLGMRMVFMGIEERFAHFHRNFQYLHIFESATVRAGDRIRSGTLTEEEVQGELARLDEMRGDIQRRQSLEVASLQQRIQQQMALIPFYRSEPGFFRPPVFPLHLLQEAVEQQQEAVNCLQLMMWAVHACDGCYEEEQQLESIFYSIRRRLQQPQQGQPQLLGQPHEQLAEDSSRNNTHTSTATATTTTAAATATGSIHDTTDSHHDLNPETLQAAERNTLSQLLQPEFKRLLLPLQPHLVEVESFVSIVLSLILAAMDHLDDWRPALKAMGGGEHALSHSLSRKEESSTNADANANQQQQRGNVLHKLSNLSMSRLLSRSEPLPLEATPESCNSATQSKEKRGKASPTPVPYSSTSATTATAESRPPTSTSRALQQEESHLYTSFQRIVDKLQQAIREGAEDEFDGAGGDSVQMDGQQKKMEEKNEEDEDHDDSNGYVNNNENSNKKKTAKKKKRTKKFQMASNREIVVVNALLASTQQLISALHKLIVAIRRMQAHRDIHVTQDGVKIY